MKTSANPHVLFNYTFFGCIQINSVQGCRCGKKVQVVILLSVGNTFWTTDELKLIEYLVKYAYGEFYLKKREESLITPILDVFRVSLSLNFLHHQ